MCIGMNRPGRLMREVGKAAFLTMVEQRTWQYREKHHGEQQGCRE